jgi:hypothetical protein
MSLKVRSNACALLFSYNLYLGMLLCSGLSANALEIPSDVAGSPLRCKKIISPILPYVCDLDPKEEFLGLRLGMNHRQAFLALLKNANDSFWTSYDSKVTPRTHSPNKAGIVAADWSVFQRADRWLLRDRGFPCVGYRYLYVDLAGSRVENFAVHCDRLAASRQKRRT